MNLTEWHDFLVAMVGAAAALTGLIFVGVSINITRILSFPKLPERAVLSIILLMNILVVCSLLLIPKQPYIFLGAVVSIIAICVYSFVTGMDVGIYKNSGEYKKQYLVSMIYNQLSLLPYVAAGPAIFISREYGIYWLVPGIILSFIKSVVDAWVLLVEINR